MPHKTMFKALESEVADRGIAKINAELNSLNKSLSKIPEKHDRHRTKKISLQIGYAIALALFIIISIALLRNAGITAMIIGGEEHITYVQSVNANITEVQEMTWVLDEHPNLFNLKSVKFSGYLKGEGSAKVYLVGSNGRRFLVLDEKTIRREGIRMITGFAINIPEGTRLAETPDERRITTVIEYNQGTTWDTDDDGTAYIEDGVVDLTVANTEFNWEADGRMLCTKWVVANEEGVETTTCNGNAECCSLAGVAPEEEEWNGPLYIFHGKYGATEQNTVMAQVVFLNQSTGEETYIESTVGEAAYTTVRFVDKPITNFRGACDETCTLPDSLDSAEYTIEVELSTGMELFIGNITYAVDKLAAEPPEEPEEPEELNSTNMTIETNATNPANDNQTSLTATGANVSYSKVKADARYDAIVDATSYDNETDTLTVVFHHNSATPLPVTVKGKADHTLDKNSSSAGENVTLVVSNWSERKFRIVVGSHTEVLEFGEAQEVTLDTTITDAEGETVAATIEVIDSVMEETVAENTGTEMTLEEGDYDVNVELTGLPITKIEIKDVPVYENTTEFIKVSDVAETGELSGYTEVYAIDPTAINFANATVTATATGSRLYKCANWSFDNQTCLDSKWVFLQSIIPGEDYTFVLTPDDPGLAEGSGTFFEGWESNSLSTNNWTQSGAGNDCVIVTQKIYAGSYSLQCMPYGAENSILTTVDTTGYTNVYFSFYATTSGLDSGEYMSADWYNGTAWTNVMPQTQTIDSYTLYNYSLPSSADNNTDLKIRFNCYAGSNNERCFVENVRVTGTYIINNTAPTHSTPVLNSSAGTNTTNENITCYNQSTYDADGDSVKNIINWYKNDTSLAVLNLPFEGTDGNEPSWTKDHSGNANHGTVYGATWSSTGGYNGRGAYSFNGANSYINLGAPSSLNFAGNTSFTISAWVKVMGGTGAHRPIVVKGDTQYTLKIYTNNTFETCAYDTTWKCAYSTSNLTQGAWYHLAARFGNGNVSLWVNGTFQSSTAYSGITTSAYDVNIGRDAQNPARLFNGMIDEVQIFDRALSAEQIQALYQGRTDMMVSQETSAGDIWKCAVTPNDGTTDGSTLESNTLTINAFIDTTPPGTISGLSEASTAKTWINWNWTNPTDSDFAEAIIYLNGTNVANTSSNHYNATGLATYTTYKLTVMTKDTTGNVNTTNVSDNAMTQDGIAPQYSDIKDQNSTQYAPGKSYQFNITWTDNINVNQVTFEFDGINHTNASSSGDEYYISLADLAAGNHTYGWYADDFLNNANQTGNITFSISNAAPALTLTAAPGWSSTYGTEVTVNCTTPDEGVTPQLYRNGTPASIPDVQALGAGEYLYVC
ncbi:LamG domain-containing protein, partial [Candidatus Woesearchaeota archaeon]|nr:LamG domain-containing protein [Candidatus Woesearchaeota archaeon]